MFFSTLKILLKNLHKDKLYSFINILGLSVSFASFLFIFLFVRNEVTHDSHFEQSENIYRLGSKVLIDGVETHHAKVGSLVAPLLSQDYEAFSKYVRMNPVTFESSISILNDEVNIQWDDKIFNADNSVFEIFNHQIIAGNPDTALLEPRTLAISQSVADLYFGQEDPIGKTLSVSAAGNDFEVVLVFKDLPDNSSLQYDILFSSTSAALSGDTDTYFEQGIVWFNDYTYFLLSENFDLGELSSISDEFFQRYVSGPSSRMFDGQNVRMEFILQPLEEIYFAPAWDEDVPKGNFFNVVALSALAFFILLVASINYMNLSTARFTRRAKDVAMRRIVGAEKTSIILQFFYEGLFFSLLSLVIGLCLVEIMLSTGLLTSLLGAEFQFDLWQGGILFSQIISAGILVGLLSSVYPALYFVAFKPVQSLKSPLSSSSFRGVLISLQMFVSVAVIASVLIMFMQVSFLNNRPLGFEKELKLDIETNGIASGNEYRAVVERLASHPDVINVSMTESIPGSFVSSEPVVMLSDDGLLSNPQLSWYIVDEHYLDTFDIELIAGRNFPAINVDSDSVEEVPLLVNQRLVDYMGWVEPVGQTIEFQVSELRGTVIGVFSDFNYRPLYKEIEPLALAPFFNNFRWQRHLIVDYQPGTLSSVLEHAEVIMSTFEPGMTMKYQFIDDNLNSLYQEEQTQLTLIGGGSIICILVAMLGLLGLTVFILEQKTKEIGIHRVLGATKDAIVRLIFSRILAVILISAFLSSVTVELIMRRWLESFAYHIQINPMVYIFATAFVFLLGLLTITLQTTRVLSNPVSRALRYE